MQGRPIFRSLLARAGSPYGTPVPNQKVADTVNVVWLGITVVFPEKSEVENDSANDKSDGVGIGAFRFNWAMGANVFGYALPKE